MAEMKHPEETTPQNDTTPTREEIPGSGGHAEDASLAPKADSADSTQEAAAAVQDEDPPTLTCLVDVNLLGQLQEMGFSEARAGRALLAIRGGPVTVEAALAWIEEHEEDSDLDQPLTAEELASYKGPKKTPLTEEEAQRLAYELQKKLREERQKREKQEAIEKERLRLQQSRAMLEQQAKLEEETRKRALEQLQREKEEAKKERERQRELLRQDYRDRFGCEMPEDPSQADPEERLAKMSGKEKVAYYSNALFKRYKKEDPQKLLVCLNTLRLYVNNAKEHPTDPKKENAAFKARVLVCDGSVELLDACGFKDQGDALAIQGQPDGFILAQAIKFLDLLIGQLRG
ncbi:UBA/TS-N domain-containing protein, putative [Eimeria mitis]|uniref:UBA/TS-N domain-containing protein, putative n=1 Tax=Eimeria mitis TaxID=44415 RepID=U6K9Z3_9EIME|nr:UBA/TS-N domain-containing protein, putative [Eimeria mitis]CDJ34825.1 UBA/TS-N domain-containing protein, putative [Eimeria mitis]